MQTRCSARVPGLSQEPEKQHVLARALAANALLGGGISEGRFR